MASSITGILNAADADISKSLEDRTIQCAEGDAQKLHSRIPELYKTLQEQSHMKNVITAAYEKYKQKPNISLIESNYDSYDFLYKESTKSYEEAIRECDEQIETISEQIIDKEKKYVILVNYLHSKRDVIRQKQEEKAKEDRDAKLLNTEVTEQSETATHNNNEDEDSSYESSSWSELSQSDTEEEATSLLQDEDEEESESKEQQPAPQPQDEDESESREEENASALQDEDEEIISILQERHPANRRGWFSRF